MNEYVLSCESPVDLTEARLFERDIHYIPFHAFLDGKEVRDDLGTTFDYREFYKAISEGVMTRTSQINSDEYRTYFEEFLKEGKDVIHLSLSGGLTGTINSARIARTLLEEEYPDRKIYLVDSLCASAGYGLLTILAADRRDEGMSIDEVYAWCEQNKLRVNHWLFSTDLTYYIRGGRISKTAGFVGKLLNICPLINIDYMGHLVPKEKIRSKKRAMDAVLNRMIELADDGLDYADRCFISHSDDYEDAKALADMIEQRFPKIKGKVEISYIGTTIGAHAGPNTVSLFFLGKERPVE